MAISLIIDEFIKTITNSKLNFISGGYYPSTLRKLKKLSLDLRAAIANSHNVWLLTYIDHIDNMLRENSVNEYAYINLLMKIKYMN